MFPCVSVIVISVAIWCGSSVSFSTRMKMPYQTSSAASVSLAGSPRRYAMSSGAAGFRMREIWIWYLRSSTVT